MDELTHLLKAACGNDRYASDELLPLVYDELRHLASARLGAGGSGQTLQPTALVHEAWLRIAADGEKSWNSRVHFFRAAAQAMRHILVDRAKAKTTLKRGEGKATLDIFNIDLADASADERVLMINEMLERLEIEQPDSARVVTLKFFGGLTNREIGEVQGVTERTAERQWAHAKALLFQMIREAAG